MWSDGPMVDPDRRLAAPGWSGRVVRRAHGGPGQASGGPGGGPAAGDGQLEAADADRAAGPAERGDGVAVVGAGEAVQDEVDLCPSCPGAGRGRGGRVGWRMKLME